MYSLEGLQRQTIRSGARKVFIRLGYSAEPLDLEHAKYSFDWDLQLVASGAALPDSERAMYSLSDWIGGLRCRTTRFGARAILTLTWGPVVGVYSAAPPDLECLMYSFDWGPMQLVV